MFIRSSTFNTLMKRFLFLVYLISVFCFPSLYSSIISGFITLELPNLVLINKEY